MSGFTTHAGFQRAAERESGSNATSTSRRARYDNLVPRYLVHRTALSEVFLTAADLEGAHTYALAGQWPRRHYYYAITNGRIDSLLVAETLRQSTILVAHTFYGVPLGQKFLMNGIQFRLLRHTITPSPTSSDLDLVVEVDRIRTRASGVVGLRTRVSFFVDGQQIAEGCGDLQLLDPRVYDRMRGTASVVPNMPNPTESNATAVLDNSGVRIVTRTAGALHAAWDVHVDSLHPVFFDHPVDHIPGMLVLEVMRQVARNVSGWHDSEIVEFDGSFERFIEISRPFWVRCVDLGPEIDGLRFMMVEAVQDDREAVRASITVTSAR